MKENKAYDFFLQAIKMVLFVLAVLFVVLIMIRWGSWGDLNQTSSPNLSVTTKPTSMPAPTRAAFNLTGPFVCEGSLQTGSISAMIQNHQAIATISAGMTTQHFLVKGDCAYYWVEKAKNGTKKCGLGSLIPLADGLLSAGMSFESLAGSSRVAPDVLKSSDILSLTKSCQKHMAIPVTMFDMPKGVLFTERKK